MDAPERPSGTLVRPPTLAPALAPAEPELTDAPTLPLVVADAAPGPVLEPAEPPVEPDVELLAPEPPALPPDADCA